MRMPYIVLGETFLLSQNFLKSVNLWSYTLRQKRAETSWSKTPKAIAGSDVKNTLYSDKSQSLYAGWAENDA